MEQPYALPAETAPASTATAWEEYALLSPGKFLILCILTLGLYGLWWQYKTWRFFRQWQQSDILPVWRVLFSIFTFHELLRTINQFADYTAGQVPLGNPTGLAAGYILLNLTGVLPLPLSLLAQGSTGFLVPPYRAFRAAMLNAPEYGGRDQAHFRARHLLIISLGIVFWGLVVVGITQKA